MKLDDPNYTVASLLLKHENVDIEVPISYRLPEGALKDQIALSVPHLEQERQLRLLSQDMLI